MTRLQPWSIVAPGLVLAILGFVGCNRGQAPTPGPTTLTRESKDQKTKLLADWPQPGEGRPAAALVISGQRNGYLEPCGCTQGQAGGIGRQYDLIERLKANGWPVALIDLGSLADPPGARGGLVQSKLEFSVALRALAEMKYDALALSADDMRQGVDEALGQYVNLNEHPAVVAANAEPIPGFDSAVRPSIRTLAGPFKVGVTAVLDPAAFEALNDPNRDLLTVNDPKDALPSVLADLETDTNVQVLMVQGPPERARELARAFPGFEVVVATSEVADPASEPEMLNDGKTMLVQVGHKGKYVGIVGLFQDSNQKFRYQRVTLNTKYKDAEPMHRLLNEDYQHELEQLKVAEDFPKHGYAGGAPGATFIGAEACQSCHPKTYTTWAGTKHADAFKALLDPERTREFDAECLTCHTTGFEYNGGFRSAALTPLLKGNQCENCHGPASRHAAEPDNTDYRNLLAQAVINPDQNRLCYKCHDEDNSPKFDFQTYYGKIVHKGLDTYDDPKVHQGIEAPSAQAEE